MPFIGTRHRTEKFQVTTKIYGPTTTFMFDPLDILKAIREMAESSEPPPAKKLASEITKLVTGLIGYDQNAMWVDCEVLQHDGVLYGDISVIHE